MDNIMGIFRKIQKSYQSYCYDAVLKDGIKMSEMTCLLFLYNHAPLDTAHDIAEHEQLSPSMVCKSVDALKAAGYLNAQRDEADSRCVHLLLTDQARPLIDKLVLRQTEFISLLVRGISDSDFTCMRHTIDQIQKNLDLMELHRKNT